MVNKFSLLKESVMIIYFSN